MEKNKINIQNKDNNIPQNGNESLNEKKCTLFCIFTIDKNNYNKDQLELKISDMFAHSQKTELINLEEKKYDKKSSDNSEIKIIQQLYMISFIPNEKYCKHGITLNLKIKNNITDINSIAIPFKSKDYSFVYEHSLEDIYKNYKNKIRINIFQNKLDLFLKFSYFLTKLKIDKWENKSLSLSFIGDTLSHIRKGKIHFSIIMNLLEITHKKSTYFYSTLEVFHENQNNIFFPKNINSKRYEQFFDHFKEKKNLFEILVNIETANRDSIYLNKKDQILIYFGALKETFYRKYEPKKYLELSENKKFLEVIKRQVMLSNINKNDLINEKIICDLLGISETIEETKMILGLCPNLFYSLKFILSNFELMKKIFYKKKLNLSFEILTNNFEKIVEIHKLLLDLEKENKDYFINFKDIIKKYFQFFRGNDLINLINLREMIKNQEKYGDQLFEYQNINEEIRRTAISLAKEEKLNSKQIIKFIINYDESIFYPKDDLNIFKLINIYEFDEKDFNNFIMIWKKISQQNYNDLIMIIFEKIGVMKDIGLIFKLIPEEIFNFGIAKFLYEKFMILFSTYQEKICRTIVNDIFNIIKIFKKVEYNFNDFLTFIEKRFSTRILSDLYLLLIKNDILSKDKNLKNCIIRFFTNKKIIRDMDTILYIIDNLNEIKNEAFINDFLNNLDGYILTEKDFFDEQSYSKIKLYKIIRSTFRGNSFNSGNYLIKSSQAITDFYNKLNNLNIIYNEAIIIKEELNKDYFKDNLKLLDDEYLSKKLKEKINEIEKNYNKLLKAKQFFKLFFEFSEQNFINEIEQLITEINNFYLINSIKDINKFFNNNEKLEFWEKYNKINESKIFTGLYLENKKKFSNEDEIKIFEATIKSFCELQILNKYNRNFQIKEIPYLEIISNSIENIINENLVNNDSKENKRNCISLIEKELKFISDAYLNKDFKNPICINSNLNSFKTNNNIIDSSKKEDKKEEKINEIKLVENELQKEDEKDEEDNGNFINIVEDNIRLNNAFFEDHNEIVEQNNIILEENNEKNSGILKEYDLGNEFNNRIYLKDDKISIKEYLIYLPFLESLKKILKSIKLLTELFKVKKTIFYREIMEIYKKVTSDKNDITLRQIEENIERLKTLGIDIASFKGEDENKIFIDFLKILCNNEEGIKYVFGKTNEEIKALSEFVGESENSKIQIKDIQDFMNVSNFFENIKALNSDTDESLIDEFKTAFITTPSFGNSFRNYLNNFGEIKNVYEEYLDKPEVSRKKIEQILKYSNIEITFDNATRLLKINGVYTDILGVDRTFNNNDLQELHDRALLFTNKIFSNISDNVVDKLEEKTKNSKIFVEIVENINILVNYLTSLYIKGYPNLFKEKIHIKDSIAVKENMEIKDVIKHYKKITSLLEESQTEAYKEKPLIRLLYGQQFYDIYNYLNNNNNNIDIISLLKKLSDNKIIKIPNRIKNNNNYVDNCDFKSMINEMNNFLDECLTINHLQGKDLYVKNIIKNEFSKKIKPGFYSWCVDEINQEIQIISIYKKLTGNLPLSITLLLCTKETNEEEITAFIYRALLCNYRVLFIILNPDSLELSNAQYFLWILESLYNKNKNSIISSLLILFNDSNSPLKKELTLLNGHEYFIIGNIGIDQNIKNDDNLNPVEIWTSDAAGVGKSTEIKYEAEKLNLKYLYFPIGGSFTRTEIINRITKLEINKDNYEKNYLHIDVYESDKNSSLIIREFLFSILITRNYSYDEKTFYLGYNAKIIVELPKGFYNMKDKFKLLNYFTNKELLLKELPKMRETEKEPDNKNKLSDIQIVTHILKMLEDNSIEENLFDIEKNNEVIPMEECETIINKYFSIKEGNYYQKVAFIHILADQFKKFCLSYYLRPDILKQNEKIKTLFTRTINKTKKKNSITNIRKIMIENLIKLTLYFVKGPYNKIVLNQKKTNTQLFGTFNEEKINEIANQSLSNKDEIITFEKINPSLVFFNEDVQTFSIITTSKPWEKEYNQLLKLYNSQTEIREEVPLINYRELTHEKFIPEVKNILNLNTLSKEQMEKIIGSYCFTSDNFIKMILILLRTRAGIPVILMGETGCGKTSLIKMLSTLLNNGKMNLETKNIHAGIKDQDIIKFIESVNNKANSEENNNSNEKIWVFFDEINTCNSMGLLSEIFYKHTYNGKALNKKLTFIAACNPYRLRKINSNQKEEDNFCLVSPDKNYYDYKQRLVYLVNPLPHSLLTSIFDFGNLSLEDEKKYIKSIVKETLKKYDTDEYVENLAIKGIVLCQNYIRNHNDVSSVSLRELRRFNILFDFFVNYLTTKHDNTTINKNNDLYIDTICLCLYFCYYIRISNNKLRFELKKEIQKVLKEQKYFDVIKREKNYLLSKLNIPRGIASNSSLSENIFALFVCIVNKIPLIICGKPGTSKSLSFQILYDSMKGNRSENDFFRQYPELLVFSYQGSKTSTSEGVQKVFNKARKVLNKNKEKNKKNNDGINNIDGQNQIKDNAINDIDINENTSKTKDDIISLVYFDEMGLAEESPNNPLKVIHSELEYDDNELKVGFVGISNWILDASKMNRTIFLGVPPLEEKDLEETAYAIGSNLDLEIFNQYKDLFTNLVKTYCKYKDEIKSSSQSEFHGLRDFYHLIKNAMQYLINEKKEKKEKNKIKINRNEPNCCSCGETSLEEWDDDDDDNDDNLKINEKSYEIGLKSLKRNFEGLREPFNSFEKVKKIFDEFYKDQKTQNLNIIKDKISFNILDCLKDNIKDNNSRYLLIIIESSMSLHLLSYIMQKLKKNYIFYSGSQLTEDVNEEKYNEKLLNKIQLSLENGDILVLKNMENIYPSLYNLFNQNFTMLGGKKFARIAFANYKSYSVVHNDFRAIVLVNEEQIREKMEDPPFLNRFEKHIFSIEYLMNDLQISIAEKIIKFMNIIISGNEKCKIDLKKQILWYTPEEIKGLVLKEFDKKIEEKNIYDNVLKTLSKLLSQDIIALIKTIDSEIDENKISNSLLEYYQSNHYYSFGELCNYQKNLFTKEKNCKLIIYTFSKLLEPCIKGENPINSFEILKRENLSEKIVNSIKNENDLEDILDDYYHNQDKKILILKFREEDLNKMNQIKIKIKQFETEKININHNIKNKHIIFIISLARQIIETKKTKNAKIKKKALVNDLISNVDEEYIQFFIDNLHGKKDKNIIKIISKSPMEYINEILNEKNNGLLKIFHQIFSYIIYELKNNKIEENNIDNNLYSEQIVYKLSNNKYVLNLIKKRIEKEFGGNLNKIINSILEEGLFEYNDIEFIDIIYKKLNDFILHLLFKIIFKAEKDNFLNPLLLNYKFIEKEKDILTYIEKYINNLDFSLVNPIEKIKSNQISLILNLNLPLSKKWFDKIYAFIENNIREDYNHNEEYLRTEVIEDDQINQQINYYIKSKKDFIDNVKGELLRIDGLNDLIKNNDMKYLKLIYIDFVTIYLTRRYKENIGKGLQFLDILIQLRLNINNDSKYSFIDNNKSINLQDSFSSFDNNIININNETEELNIKYDQDTLSKILIFLICYNDEIYDLLEIFLTLDKYLQNFFSEWKDIISNKEINYEINENLPAYTREVNESFFIIYESLIKCIFKYQGYKKISDDNFYEYLDSIKKISKTAIQIYYKLYLPSKEMYTLQILINIFTSFDSCKNKKMAKDIKEIFINIIDNINNENYFIEKGDFQGLEENYKILQNILDTLIDKEKNEKEYSLLLNNLFIYRFNKSLDKEFRKKISIIYFNNITEYQIKHILPILKRIIDNVEPKIISNEADLTKEDCINDFMKNFTDNDNNDNLELYKIINDINIDSLEMNILFYFECECNLYFKKLEKGRKLSEINIKDIEGYMNNILSDLSFEYFVIAMDYYLGEREFNEDVKKLGKIYCIAYIKNYLKKLSEFITFNKDKNVLNFENIFKKLLSKKNNKLIFSLKLFLFKYLFKNENKNYVDFIESIKTKNDYLKLLNHDEFIILLSTKEIIHSYNFSFININTFEYYQNLNNIIDISLENFEQNKLFSSIADYINSNNTNYKGFDFLFDILVNKYILDLYKNENGEHNLDEKANKIFNKFRQFNLNLHNNSQKLINYLIDKNSFSSKILPKLKLQNNDITSDQLYILLFCIKFVILIQFSQNNLFSLFYLDKSQKQQLIEFIRNNYIPGSFQNRNEFIESYYEIENHLKNEPSDNAAYICSCGKFYNIRPCGFPREKSKCVKCGLEIGGQRHKLIRREGHYRIFLNEDAKKKEFSKKYADKTMPFKYFDNFKREVIDPLLNTPNKGIGQMTKENINKSGINIRNINELSFRIINFILCSHLLVANILEILDDKDLSQYFSEETSCFGIILDNWKKMEELLQAKEINNIKIYMNLIYEEIVKIICKHDSKYISISQGRDIIENEINGYITEDNDIKEKIKKYEQQNEQILKISPYYFSSIIQEIYPIKHYDNDEYPYFKYLYDNNYPEQNNLYDIIDSNNDYKNKYPLTYNILKCTKSNKDSDLKKQIELLKYIPKVNKKINHLLLNYSYIITRDEANKTTIENEYNKTENNIFTINRNKNKKNIHEYLSDIIYLFNEFKDVDLQWGCQKLQKMNLTTKSELACVLLDDNEPGFYLSSIYKKLIEYQNLFLDNIINCNVQNGLLHCFVKQLNNEMMIQDANINEIVKIDFKQHNNNNLKLYSSIDELIFINTSKIPNINNFNYELEQIEIELGNIILPGVRKFKSSDDELRYITYMFEGYRGKNSNILTNFNEKYPPKEMSDNEKRILNKYIKENINNNDYKPFLFSIQLLIDYIQKTGKDQSIPINDIINDIPDHINITEDVKVFFNRNKEFKINNLVKIFELFEFLCWEQIKENLLEEFMKPIDNNKKELIKKYFINHEDKSNYIKKIDLANATRKFISRYLAGKRSQSEINENGMLFDYLNRIDLWEKSIDDPKFENEFSELSKIKLTVGEGKDFYDILGGDSQLSNLDMEEKIKNRNEIKEDDDNENKNIINIIEDEDEKEEINTYNRKQEKNDIEQKKNPHENKKKAKRKLF